MILSDNEKRDAIRMIENGKPLPERYRFLLFDDDREVELVWNGKTNEVASTVLPFQTIEHIDEPRSEEKIERKLSLFDTSGRQISGWTNKLIWGDNKLILSSLKNGPLRKAIEAAGGLKLIYIDPPFDVGADFSMNIEIGDESFTKQPSVIEEVAYRDIWGKGADSFIAMIYERLRLMHDLLADDGSIYVHCDWRLSGYMRLVLDDVFGKDNFIDEIVWHYPSMSNTSRFFPRKHDVIMFYSKSSKYCFNANDEKVREKYKAGTLERSKYAAGFNNNAANYLKSDSKLADTVWEIPHLKGNENIGYPTQKPSKMLERIISASSNEGDLVADFFCGSGTTLAVAEKLGRKWIGSDLGRFGIHTSRKRMIGVQRELKKAGQDYRAFEILNVGRYEREYYVDHIDGDLREEEKRQIKERKEREFVNLILSAYKAEPVASFNTFVGKKRDRLIAVGPVDAPVTSGLVREIVAECKEKGITKADVLGFDYEMGLDFEEAKKAGLDIGFRKIPREVFDKKAVEKGQVRFYDVAFLEVKPIVKGRGSKKTIAIELADFSVFYNQDDATETEEKLRPGGSKVVVENGQIIKITKDKKTNVIEREQLTKKWSDWIDYWAVDFDFESRKEIIRTKKEPSVQAKLDGTTDPVQMALDDYEETWTGSYIFENEWQSFRTKKDKSLELVSAEKEVISGRRKVAIKVVDIFGNDTTKVIEVNV
ncbi:MAG: site-specific DNA-methyltransferase [Candidatus Moraniibacteriota bacterium]